MINHLVIAHVGNRPIASLFEHSGPQFTSSLLESFREHLSDEQVAAFKGFFILDYLLTVFEVEKFYDCWPLFGAVHIMPIR